MFICQLLQKIIYVFASCYIEKHSSLPVVEIMRRVFCLISCPFVKSCEDGSETDSESDSEKDPLMEGIVF